MLVLGIESTCDETAIALVRDGREILVNLIASQEKIHQSYGGVYPELAAREHIQTIIPLIEEALNRASVSYNEIDLIAVSQGPGLIGSLLIGLNTAKALAMGWDKPLIGINHVEAHLYAAMMGISNPPFPSLGLVISGGHTSLLKIESIGSYQLLGATVDDAIGEAFDKVAKMLNLAYPGGPEIEKLAKEGDPNRFSFRAGRIKNAPLNFSFSGLKTAVLYKLQELQEKGVTEQDKKDIAASFQKAAFDDLYKKTLLAQKENPSMAVYIGGGVSINQNLRDLFSTAEDLPDVYWPDVKLCMDNGAMIAGLAYHKYLQGEKASLDMVPFVRTEIFRKVYSRTSL